MSKKIIYLKIIICTNWSLAWKNIDLITHTRYCTAISRSRTSSHTLEIEHGRYTVTRTPINDRLRCVCKLVEEEAHFLSIYE